MTSQNSDGKFIPPPRPATRGGNPGAGMAAPGNRWSPPAPAGPRPENRSAGFARAGASSAAPRTERAGVPAAVRPPRPLASIELFQQAQALLLALPEQPPVLRREGVELVAALGAGYLNGDGASLIAALNETRGRCGRLLALITALCPAQLPQFEAQLHGLHRASGYFIRYLREQQRLAKSS